MFSFSLFIQHTLAKLYIEILGLGKESQDAKKLINYRAPTAKQVRVFPNGDNVSVSVMSRSKVISVETPCMNILRNCCDFSHN